MNAATLTPELVIQKQLDAYNHRNLEALLEIYADNAQLFEHPAKLVATGTAELRDRFVASLFNPTNSAQNWNRDHQPHPELWW